MSSDGTPPRKLPVFPRVAAPGKEHVEVAVDRRDKLVFKGPLTDFTAALSALVPSPRLLEKLEECAEEHYEEESEREDADPIDLGNSVNGEAWGWVQGKCSVESETESWFLLPQDFQQTAVELSKAFESMEESMVGGFNRAAVKFTTIASLYSFSDDNEGLLVFDVTYNPNPKLVARRPFVDVLDRFRGPGAPWCPLCEDNEWRDYSIRLWAEPHLAPGVEERAWREVFRLCKKHRSDPRPTFEDGNGTLTLVEGRWVGEGVDANNW